ncbi:hypothetical protein QBC46DRAFT_404942 [Diplogelasinospora grovesii]|uniref:Uncharacterized protein n=1 Tax=Diplogelasinospora grovesii TaxID=303347 RepID=A0AAN6NE25_9PEZI|nr:hypothetical protein QBC46DRAFT_404942 [Diplogelasinospora grovesii]
MIVDGAIGWDDRKGIHLAQPISMSSARSKAPAQDLTPVRKLGVFAACRWQRAVNSTTYARCRLYCCITRLLRQQRSHELGSKSGPIGGRCRPSSAILLPPATFSHAHPLSATLTGSRSTVECEQMPIDREYGHAHRSWALQGLEEGLVTQSHSHDTVSSRLACRWPPPGSISSLEGLRTLLDRSTSPTRNRPPSNDCKSDQVVEVALRDTCAGQRRAERSLTDASRRVKVGSGAVGSRRTYINPKKGTLSSTAGPPRRLEVALSNEKTSSPLLCYSPVWSTAGQASGMETAPNYCACFATASSGTGSIGMSDIGGSMPLIDQSNHLPSGLLLLCTWEWVPSGTGLVLLCNGTSQCIRTLPHGRETWEGGHPSQSRSSSVGFGRRHGQAIIFHATDPPSCRRAENGSFWASAFWRVEQPSSGLSESCAGPQGSKKGCRRLAGAMWVAENDRALRDIDSNTCRSRARSFPFEEAPQMEAAMAICCISRQGTAFSGPVLTLDAPTATRGTRYFGTLVGVSARYGTQLTTLPPDWKMTGFWGVVESQADEARRGKDQPSVTEP